MLTSGIRIKQLDGSRWIDCCDGMFVDKLRAIAPHKLDSEPVEGSDLAQA
jgi:hypothetical protein